MGHEAFQKGTAYQHGVQKYFVYPVDISPLHKKHSNEILQRDDGNLAHTDTAEINCIHITS